MHIYIYTYMNIYIYTYISGAEKGEMIATLEGKNHMLSSDLTQSQAHVRRLEKQIANSQSQEIEVYFCIHISIIYRYRGLCRVETNISFRRTRSPRLHNVTSLSLSLSLSLACALSLSLSLSLSISLSHTHIHTHTWDATHCS